MLPIDSARLGWDALRHNVREQGMRHSNVLATAPTATISNIVGVSQSIEPTYRNLFVKANMSGDFTVVNEHLVDALKARGLRSTSATHVEKSTLRGTDGRLTGVPLAVVRTEPPLALACSIENPDCGACQ